LASLVDIPNSEFLFVAEVSITYMETADADAVIGWASTLGQGRTIDSHVNTWTPRTNYAFS
jgi:hypothetical protein